MPKTLSKSTVKVRGKQRTYTTKELKNGTIAHYVSGRRIPKKGRVNLGDGTSLSATYARRTAVGLHKQNQQGLDPSLRQARGHARSEAESKWRTRMNKYLRDNGLPQIHEDEAWEPVLQRAYGDEQLQQYHERAEVYGSFWDTKPGVGYAWYADVYLAIEDLTPDTPYYGLIDPEKEEDLMQNLADLVDGVANLRSTGVEAHHVLAFLLVNYPANAATFKLARPMQEGEGNEVVIEMKPEELPQLVWMAIRQRVNARDLTLLHEGILWENEDVDFPLWTSVKGLFTQNVSRHRLGIEGEDVKYH